ncbi:MAG: hypothetical protein PUP90_27745, partial [Nostoc sp. S4]|nr:hypothetical protein [Nostoc sp. S4]
SNYYLANFLGFLIRRTHVALSAKNVTALGLLMYISKFPLGVACQNDLFSSLPVWTGGQIFLRVLINHSVRNNQKPL